MNLLAMVILVALVVEWGIHVWADVLNLKNKPVLPPEAFRDVFDPDKYGQSIQYLRATTRFGWVVSFVNLAVLIWFWLAGGFGFLDQWVRSLGFGPVVSGLIYTGILVLGRTLINLPFDIYATFGIEARFGFNRTDAKTFVLDLIKGAGLTIVLGGPLLAGILIFFQYSGSLAWVYCWIGVTVYLLAVRFIAPTWIMPLFNRFTPLEDGPLKTAIMDYAKRVGFSLTQVSIMDGSRRSTKANAFFTGFGANKRIALFDTLIEKHSIAELVAITAHEIGHYKKRHIWWMTIIGIIQTGIMFGILALVIRSRSLFDAFYVDQMSVYAGLIFFALLMSPVDFILGLIFQAISRKHEYEADRFAVETTRDPESMCDALKKLSANNLSDLNPHPLYVRLHYSHPPIMQRIQAIRQVPIGSESGSS